MHSSTDTLRLAAEWGIGALVLGFCGPSEMKEPRDFHHRYIAERTGENLVSPRGQQRLLGAVPDDRARRPGRGIQVGPRGQQFFAEAIAHWYGGGPLARRPSRQRRPGRRESPSEAADDFVAHLHEAEIPSTRASRSASTLVEHAYGSRRDAIAYAEALEEAGVDEILCCIQMGTVPPGGCLETIRQWGEHVIPHFREREGADVSVAGAEA